MWARRMIVGASLAVASLAMMPAISGADSAANCTPAGSVTEPGNCVTNIAHGVGQIHRSAPGDLGILGCEDRVDHVQPPLHGSRRGRAGRCGHRCGAGRQRPDASSPSGHRLIASIPPDCRTGGRRRTQPIWSRPWIVVSGLSGSDPACPRRVPGLACSGRSVAGWEQGSDRLKEEEHHDQLHQRGPPGPAAAGGCEAPAPRRRRPAPPQPRPRGWREPTAWSGSRAAYRGDGGDRHRGAGGMGQFTGHQEGVDDQPLAAL